MNEFENNPLIDDQIVEITDLDPDHNSSRLSRMFATLEKRPLLRKRLWRSTIASCSVLLVLLVLFSTFSSIRGLAFSFFSRSAPSQPATLATPVGNAVNSYLFNPKDEVVWTLGDSSPFIPSATLGPAPVDCPRITQTQGFEYRGAPRAVGSPPVLIIGFGGTDAVLTNFQHAQPPEIGWYKRILLLAETNYAGTVSFRGGEIHDGSPIWFGIKPPNKAPITTLTVLPLNSTVSNHTMGDEEWGLSSASMYIPRAGCYFLLATWPQGSWIVFFAAGR